MRNIKDALREAGVQPGTGILPDSLHYNHLLNLVPLNKENSFVQWGNFEWENGVPDTKVVFVTHHPGHRDAKFLVSVFIDEEFKQSVKEPIYKELFFAGANPFKFDVRREYADNTGAGAVYAEKIKRFCCSYNHRPDTRMIYGEDMIKMCVYYGCMLLPEMNVPFLWDYFYSRGYNAFLPDVDSVPGIMNQRNMTFQVKHDMITLLIEHFKSNVSREFHLDILKQASEVEGDNFTQQKLLVAAGFAMILRKELLNII